MQQHLEETLTDEFPFMRQELSVEEQEKQWGDVRGLYGAIRSANLIFSLGIFIFLSFGAKSPTYPRPDATQSSQRRDFFLT